MTTENPSGENDSTQPFSPTGVVYDALHHVNGGESSDDDRDCVAIDDTRKVPPREIGQTTEKVAANTKYPIVKTSITVTTVTWTDHAGLSSTDRSYTGEGFTLKVVLDMSRRTGLFTLQADIQLKHNDLPTRLHTIYLFIYPENIHVVTGEEPLYTLKFTLKRPPDLIVPKGKPLESGPATNALLESMFALAKVTVLDIQLPATTMLQKDIKVVSSILCHLSLNHHISTDKRSADLKSLYMGDGGEVVNFDDDTGILEANPPLYENHTTRSSNKRKRKCTSSDLDRRRATTSGPSSSKSPATAAPPAGGDSRIDDIYKLLVGMNDRLMRIERRGERIERRSERIESRVDQIERQVERIDSRLEQIDGRVEQIDGRVEQIEKTLASEGSQTASQTMSEVRLELLEELNDRIDHEVIDVQTRYSEAEQGLEDKIEEFENTVTEVLENLERNVGEAEERLEEGLDERIQQAVSKHMREELQSVTIQGSFLFNKQASADQ